MGKGEKNVKVKVKRASGEGKKKKRIIAHTIFRSFSFLRNLFETIDLK